MELVQEVYEKLKEQNLAWPDHAVVVVKDNDGEIKFSSIGKYDIAYVMGVYNRGNNCLFNNRQVPDVCLGYGKSGVPDIITRSDYESFYFAKETK